MRRSAIVNLNEWADPVKVEFAVIWRKGANNVPVTKRILHHAIGHIFCSVLLQSFAKYFVAFGPVPYKPVKISCFWKEFLNERKRDVLLKRGF